MLGNLIGGFVTILVGVNLVPEVANGVWAAQSYVNETGPDGATNTSLTNVTGTAATIVNLTTLFFVLGIVAAGIALSVQGLRKAGMM